MKNKSPLKCRMPIPPSCRLTASNGIRLTGKRKSYEAALNRALNTRKISFRFITSFRPVR